ncbi:hypothetical protein CO674_25075 [Rhizobium hidalgonense]|uniref:Secreted protein n=1 Tax=Rhizobium hidalgonense TaxID=1538159 RepID=A0ABX4JQE3_9HYPH|nr:hypothetical protein CO674_25075 [Rhizobium hidalgonense]PON07199.1 hypothetical protein ATY29_12755 [Rhizobium hidalgonense]
MDGSHWAILLGTLALASWMLAGLIAVLGTRQETRSDGASRGSEFFSLALAGAGAVLAVIMAASIVLS